MEEQGLPGPKLGRYIDIRSDWGFKYIFSGAEPSKEILIAFLNDLLEGRKRITDLTYGPTEHLGETAEHRKVIFDLRCTTDKRTEIIVEMQRMNHLNFVERVVFGISRLISGQYPKGAEYWDFELPEVVFIGILEFRMDEADRERYLKNIALIEQETGKIFYDKLTFIFLELPNFVKKEEEITEDVDRWFWLMNNLSEADSLPRFMDIRVFRKIFQIARVSNLTKEEKMAYEASLQDKWLWNSAISMAEEKAERKGIEKTRKEERAKAEKLLADERAKAEAEKIKAAKKMLQSGIDVQLVADILDMTVEQVEKFK